MGAKSGKYELNFGNSVSNENKTLSLFSLNSNGPIPNEGLGKEGIFSPVLLHQGISNEVSSSEVNDLTIVWLDTEMKARPENIDTQVALKYFSNYLRTFEQIDAFENYVEQVDKINRLRESNEEKLLAIVSTALALTIIPSLHDRPQVKFIYIYGKSEMDAEVSRELLKKYTKVRII